MRQPLAIPPQAEALHARMLERLGALADLEAPSPLDPNFMTILRGLWRLFARYQVAVVEASRFSVRCGPGCAHCCRQWVDNVFAFEVAILAETLRRRHADRLLAIRSRCQEDVRVFAGCSQGHSLPQEDPAARAMEAFYRLDRPCPLLTSKNRCRVYSVRPLMCRAFLSFSEPGLCRPRHPAHAQALTCLLDLDTDAGGLLHVIDRRFRIQGHDRRDTGLRSLLDQQLT